MKGNIARIINNTYGFIEIETISDNRGYFFHKTDFENCDIYDVEEGDCVEFDVEPGRDGRGHAVHIRKLYKSVYAQDYANPGLNPSVNLDHFYDDERSIIECLCKVFYVTNGGDVFYINKSKYKYCLIKPTEEFVHLFNLNREIVVIFDDYLSFEPRTLDAASVVYNRIESQLRLDRGCHVLISHDPNIENGLNSVLRDSNVNQIVIPYSYDEFKKNESTEWIVNRFKKYLFDVDLFAVSSPIKDNVFFFGRRDYVQDIATKCCNATHCGIFGLRRSGKTSMLYAVRNLLVQQGVHTVFIPCESDLANVDWKGALYKVVLDTYKALGTDDSHLHEVDYVNGNASNLFEKDMFKCLAAEHKPTTLMFDEIEAITFNVTHGERSKEYWVDGISFCKFWNTIKGYCTKYPEHISILIAGTNPMINEIHSIGKNLSNPMFSLLSSSRRGAYLPAFTQTDTKNMVNQLGGYMGLSFDDYSIGRLTTDCGGHPYLIRIMCSHINKYAQTHNIKRPFTITQAIYDKAIPGFEASSEARSFFWMILNILQQNYPLEFETLKVLALQGDSVIAKTQGTDALQHLLGYGLVENNQRNYAIRYNIISRFLRDEYKFEQDGLDIEEQKQEIYYRVNKAEIQLRTLVKNALVMRYGEVTAKSKVISAMNGCQAITNRDVEKANDLEYGKLFDTSVNKMYITLLSSIIQLNADAFTYIFVDDNGQAFDSTVIRNNMKKINEARICADHSFTDNSINWSWDKFSEFREAMVWLERVLKRFQ